MRDYADTARLAYRLNQVLRRVKLDPLPAGIEEPLSAARGIVESYADGMLPPPFSVVPPARPPPFSPPRQTDMKYGMNMLLWTTNVEPSHDPIFEMLKECGYDGVEDADLSDGRGELSANRPKGWTQ